MIYSWILLCYESKFIWLLSNENIIIIHIVIQLLMSLTETRTKLLSGSEVCPNGRTSGRIYIKIYIHHTHKFTLGFVSLNSYYYASFIYLFIIIIIIIFLDLYVRYDSILICYCFIKMLSSSNQCNQSIIIVLNSLLIVLPERAP
jgi:hypothetical protein